MPYICTKHTKHALICTLLGCGYIGPELVQNRTTQSNFLFYFYRNRMKYAASLSHSNRFRTRFNVTTALGIIYQLTNIIVSQRKNVQRTNAMIQTKRSKVIIYLIHLA